MKTTRKEVINLENKINNLITEIRRLNNDIARKRTVEPSIYLAASDIDEAYKLKNENPELFDYVLKMFKLYF